LRERLRTDASVLLQPLGHVRVATFRSGLCDIQSGVLSRYFARVPRRTATSRFEREVVVQVIGFGFPPTGPRWTLLLPVHPLSFAFHCLSCCPTRAFLWHRVDHDLGLFEPRQVYDAAPLCGHGWLRATDAKTPLNNNVTCRRRVFICNAALADSGEKGRRHCCSVKMSAEHDYKKLFSRKARQ
jgi:hypothetical protein